MVRRQVPWGIIVAAGAALGVIVIGACGGAGAPATTQPGVAPPASRPSTQAVVRRVHLFISGRVQGVGFRDWTVGTATARKLTGWVRNLPARDGRVEAVIEGPAATVAEMVQLLHKGPPSASVEKVEVKDETPTGEFKRFTRLATPD